MRMELTAPVLFLIFNRPDVTARVFAAIRNARPQRLYLAADGARPNRTGETEAVQRTRAMVLEHIDWDCQVQTLLRSENLGCKHAVSSAISWFFKQESEGIVLEDDTLPSSSFFQFQQEMLARYRDDTRIMRVAGFNPVPGQHAAGGADYFFSHYAFVWGWGSWRRAWATYDAQMTDWPDFLAEGKHTSYPFFPDRTRLFSVTHAGKLDTWDYQWEYAMAKNSGLQVVPRRSLVQNIGFGSGATHTRASNPKREGVQAEELDFPLCVPKFTYPDIEYERAILRTVTPGKIRRLIEATKNMARPLLPAPFLRLIRGGRS